MIDAKTLAHTSEAIVISPLALQNVSPRMPLPRGVSLQLCGVARTPPSTEDVVAGDQAVFKAERCLGQIIMIERDQTGHFSLRLATVMALGFEHEGAARQAAPLFLQHALALLSARVISHCPSDPAWH